MLTATPTLPVAHHPSGAMKDRVEIQAQNVIMVKMKEKALDYFKSTCCLPLGLRHSHFTFLIHIEICLSLHKYSLSILLGLIFDK